MGQKGDSIIGVILAIAVIGITVFVVYRLIGSGMQLSTTSQQYSQSLAAINTQIERLKWMSENDEDQQIFFAEKFASTNPPTQITFCLDQPDDWEGKTPLNILGDDANEDIDCDWGISSSNESFRVTITYRPGNDDDPHIFEVTADSDDMNQPLTFYYRLHPVNFELD